jgi:hypothetical protein
MKKKDLPHIAERVKFWEEQDRINKAMIPRILKNHDLLTELAQQIASISKLASRSELKISSTFQKCEADSKQIQEKLRQHHSAVTHLVEQLPDYQYLSRMIFYCMISCILTMILSLLALIIAVTR